MNTDKRRFLRALYVFAVLSLSACGRPTPASTPQVVMVYATPAAQPWLAELYDCAPSSVVIQLSAPQTADLTLRIGEPPSLAAPAYQIDSEDILIVTHRQSPVQNLTLEQARALFAGQGDPSVQVWVFSSGEDVQQVFERVVMQGAPVTSLARLATSPQQMLEALNAEKNAVGILPRRWKAGEARDVFKVATVPVLAIVRSGPQGAVKGLLACLQK